VGFVGSGAEARLWQTALLLALVACLGVLWLSVRRRDSGRRFASALAFLAAAGAFTAVMWWVSWPWDAALRALALLAFFFGVVRVVVVTVDLIARRRRAYFSTIFRDLVTLFLYGVVILVVARATGIVDVTPLLATSALVTAVIGLALQETLGNVFSGLSLQMQKPFEPGDWVRFGPYLGRVQGIGWRSTRLLSRSLELLEVPNAHLAKEVITNYRGTAIGDELFVGVSYQTPPNQTKEVILQVLEHQRDVAKMPPAQVLVVEYGDFAVRYRIRFWMVDYARQDLVRDEILTSVWYAFRRHGIEIPYPVRTLQLRDAIRPERDAAELQRERVAALRQVDFLSELTDDEFAVLVPNLREAAFGRGEVICREGDAGETFYVVWRGTVEIVARGARGEDTHVADLVAPAFFGEMSLLTGEPRSATARAKTDAELLVVEREGFERLFQSRPTIADAVSRVLAERQHELRERREQVAVAESAESRSRRLLLKMRSIFRF
jgi:small-conductance mechanosensitive channel/CRP-like cAMP-binding protein